MFFAFLSARAHFWNRDALRFEIYIVQIPRKPFFSNFRKKKKLKILCNYKEFMFVENGKTSEPEYSLLFKQASKNVECQCHVACGFGIVHSD